MTASCRWPMHATMLEANLYTRCLILSCHRMRKLHDYQELSVPMMLGAAEHQMLTEQQRRGWCRKKGSVPLHAETNILSDPSLVAADVSSAHDGCNQCYSWPWAAVHWCCDTILQRLQLTVVDWASRSWAYPQMAMGQHE